MKHVAIVPASGLTALIFLFGLHAVPAEAKEKSQPWNKTMHEMMDALADLTPELFTTDPGRNKVFVKNLKKVVLMSQKIDQSQAHPGSEAPDTDPGLISLSRQFRQEMERAAASADSGQIDFAKDVAKSSVSYCIACHTRGPSGPQFPALGAFEKSLRTVPWVERMSFKAATRQFDEALKEIHAQLGSPLNQTRPLDLERGVRIGLMVAVRAKESPDLAVALVDAVQRSAGASVSLKESAQSWMKDLKSWQGAKASVLDSDEKLINATREILKDVDEGARTGRDEIKYLRASTLMHDLLRQFPKSASAGEAMYWVGSAYDVMGDLGFWNLGDFYFMSCIEHDPHTELSERCYRRYKDSIVFGYTGSAGTSIPKAVRSHLKDVETLAMRKTKPADRKK